MIVTASARRTTVWPLLLGVALLAGCTAAGLAALSLADALTATGLPDPGPVTTIGLPFVRAAGEIAAVVAVGSFLFAAFFVPPQHTGVLDAAGYRALRTGTLAAGAWAVCAALLVPLTISDVSGQPLHAHLSPASIWSVANLVDIAGAWRWTAFLAAVVAIGSIPVLRWSWTPILFAGSLVTLIPLGLTGHSSAGGSHDLGTNSLLIHLFAAALWAGGLLALLAHALRGSAITPTSPRGGSPRWRCGASSRWHCPVWSTPSSGSSRGTCCTPATGRWWSPRWWRCVRWGCSAGGSDGREWRRCKRIHRLAGR